MKFEDLNHTLPCLTQQRTLKDKWIKLKTEVGGVIVNHEVRVRAFNRRIYKVLKASKMVATSPEAKSKQSEILS